LGLLLNILPEMIAEQLKQQPTTIADSFLEVTVLQHISGK
jgi:adenylate cyclase